MPNKTELKKAAVVLQKAHDYIETYGFDIMSYPPRKKNDEQVISGRTKEGACCYIGSVRLAAGINPSPSGGNPAAGDGPELKIALKTLDKIAAKSKWAKKVGKPDDYSIGTFIEQVGFEIKYDYEDKKREESKALDFFRRALTDIHKQIETV